MNRKHFLLIAILLSLPSCQQPTKYFSVTWLNYDDTVLEVDSKVRQGSMPHYDSATPTKEKDEIYDYIFSSWSPELSPVKSDVTYKATFDALERTGELHASHESGFYDESFQLSFDCAYGFDIYYTLDCSEPNQNSYKYESPILISDVSSNDNYYSVKQGISPLNIYYPTDLVDKCTVIKAVAINRVSHVSTPVMCYNYFVGYQNKIGYENMPIVTLNMTEADLFDYEKGIYVLGKIYDESPHEGYPETYPANYQQKGKEWERPASFKYFNEAGELDLEQDIGVRIHGGWSRAFNQKSFNLYARKEYSGDSTFKKAFFDDIYSHSLMLRSGGYRDTDLTKIRDSLDQDLSINEGFDIQRSKPVIVFLNGEYWGIYNLQERFSDNYVAEHHDINKKNVLIIKNDGIDEGDEDDYHYYEELISFFQEHNFDESSNYELAKNYIDVNEFASYMATQLYIGNIDWPGNNVRVYKDVSDLNSKWHFMMYDTDDSSGILSYKCGADIDPFIKSSHWKSGPLEEDCLLGLMLSKLIANNTFRTLFRTTFMRIGQNNFSYQNVQAYLDEKIALLSKPMVNNYRRFVNSGYDENYFKEKVDVISNFFKDRYSYAIDFLNLHIPELVS